MSRHLSLRGPANLALGVGLLLASAAACGEDGKTVPSVCPVLPIYDIQGGGDGKLTDPADCVTDVGHAVNLPPMPSGGTSSTGGKGGASSTGGSGGKGGKAPADAGAGGS